MIELSIVICIMLIEAIGMEVTIHPLRLFSRFPSKSFQLCSFFSSIKVRGHNVFWAIDRHVQSWVRGLNQHDLLQEMSKRINGVIGHTKGL